jgi:ribosome-associated protein
MEIRIEELAEMLSEWLEEKKAENIRIYDVRDRSDYTDMIMVCEGSSDLHNRAIADHILGKSKENSVYVLGREGLESGTWILIDLVSVIIHIFDEETRSYYDIEKLWEVSNRLRNATDPAIESNQDLD